MTLGTHDNTKNVKTLPTDKIESHQPFYTHFPNNNVNLKHNKSFQSILETIQLTLRLNGGHLAKIWRVKFCIQIALSYVEVKSNIHLKS